MTWQLVSIPVVGALIGWITNILAIKLIFRPHQPIIIPVLNFRIQGLIPKRRGEIAANTGQVIGNELLSLEDVMEKLHETDLQKKMINCVNKVVREKMEERIPIIVPTPIKKILFRLIEETLQKESPALMKKLFQEFADKLQDEISFAQIVEDKLNSFDLMEMERVVLAIAAKELKHIEILGGVLGFIIGLVQAVIIYFWKPV